jgi:hypothetical protein
MHELSVVLALNGAGIMMVSLVAGLLLHRSLVRGGNVHGWHLLHAGGSGRGVMLLALAPTAPLAALDPWMTSLACILVVVFAWASTLAMVLVGATGQHGFAWEGPPVNKAMYGLYVIGGATVFPGFALLGVGWALALRG